MKWMVLDSVLAAELLTTINTGQAKEDVFEALPAPDGPIYTVMRLYWPKAHPPSILPVGEDTWQRPAIVKVE
jgi:hypothetical protein